MFPDGLDWFQSRLNFTIECIFQRKGRNEIIYDLLEL